MIGMPKLSFQTSLPLAAGVMLAVCLSGCGREEITTYRVPKEVAAPAMAAGPGESFASMAKMAEAGKPGVSWQLPAGWVEKPGSKMS